MSLGRLVVIAGPTAVGKTALSLRLAEQLDGEVVNADSMQLYRGMDIGTAKLAPGERRGIPHHQLDVWDVAERASVADYQAAARADIGGVLDRGRTPILVGGSALYLQAVLDDLDFPGTDARVRGRLEAELADRGAAALHAELTRRDPDAARSVHAADGRRVVRALEVLEITGRPFRARLPPAGPPRFDAALLWLDRDTPDLDARIAARVDGMLEHGFLDEVEGLRARGLAAAPTAGRALGYAQLLQALDGRTTVDEAVAATVVATRRFVRRQRSWFRRDPRWEHWAADRPDLADRLLDRLHRAGAHYDS